MQHQTHILTGGQPSSTVVEVERFSGLHSGHQLHVEFPKLAVVGTFQTSLSWE